jgi:hypothetical protein
MHRSVSRTHFRLPRTWNVAIELDRSTQLPSASLDTGRSVIRIAVPTPTSDFRSRNRKFQHDDALENDLATPAKEITSRHGVDKGLLLPVAARRDAVARTNFLVGELRR